MVSLINFKMVNEDFVECQIEMEQNKVNEFNFSLDEEEKEKEKINLNLNRNLNFNLNLNSQFEITQSKSKSKSEKEFSLRKNKLTSSNDQQDNSINNNNNNRKEQQQQQQDQLVNEDINFVVSWRNLRFAFEPKWHRKIINKFNYEQENNNNNNNNNIEKKKKNGEENKSKLNLNVEDKIGHEERNESKVVLDRLDGSFCSGELTAILGPSGAGKTTLLDCLTGHKRSGLSGSIRISALNSNQTTNSQSSSNNSNSNSNNNNDNNSSILSSRRANYSQTRRSTRHSSQFEKTTTRASTIRTVEHSDNLNESNGHLSERKLKVSIIPQNDHLIGHLSVFETLNYASKMKNCFDKKFDHRANIARVAQQLGLLSCLETRINKLSGGQYKRVSIAQELLSSPDILILDEPTSGLDAMTCFQTVQVLRRLTQPDDSGRRRQMAVILTIHQPNCDVFQQFNHVYVVAQGGKCIFEGPPANIEPMINQVGVALPSQNYNPATLIVEVAAGKFGAEAIEKLNGFQKKQYDNCSFYMDTSEQTSTGDSAVECPSSASSISFGDYDEDDNEITNEDDDDDDDDDGQVHGREELEPTNQCQPRDSLGLINRGFVMESESNEPENVVVMLNDSSNVKENEQTNNKMVKLDMASSNVSSSSKKMRSSKQPSKRTEPPSGGQITSSLQNDNNRSAIVVGDTNHNHNHNHNHNNYIGQVKQRRKVSAGSQVNLSSCREKRLKLNSLKADQKFPFWRHTYLHFHRSWLSIVRDPMLCSMQLALHIIVPLMVSLVYGSHVGRPNACPRAGPMDIMAYALEPEDSALKLQEDLRTTLENIGYIFFKLYGIIFAAMTVTVLTFPLDMHVLVKEFRNGWYGLSSYFLGRTLADIPFQLTLPLLAMSLSYYATGQPSSHFQWRFLSITLILILSSLIAQSQGLLFGAILMDRMKAAVFVAPAATTPIILFAGFLVRTQSIPSYLRPLSNLSYLRYAIEACLISRYGFNQCECDPSVFNQTVPELPPIARSMLDYWLVSFRASSTGDQSMDGASNGTELTTTPSSSQDTPDLFSKLIQSLAKANSFGRNITSCEQVVPYPMMDYDLKDSQLIDCFAILLFMLIFTRLLTFFIVCFKVKRKV